jgi:hypothetical protein
MLFPLAIRGCARGGASPAVERVDGLSWSSGGSLGVVVGELKSVPGFETCRLDPGMPRRYRAV